MLQRTQILQPHDDIISETPNELLYAIILFLNDKEIIKLSEVSKRFNEFIKDIFFNSAYGKSLRFSKWQQTELINCKADIVTYIKACKERFLQDSQMQLANINPRREQAYRINNKATMFTNIAFFALICVNLYNYQKDPSAYNLALLLGTIAIAAGLYKANTTIANRWRQHDYQYDEEIGYSMVPVSTINKSDFDALLKKYQHLFKGVEGLDQRRDGRELYHLIRFLNFNIKEIGGFANRFNEYLVTLRFNNKHYLDLSNPETKLGQLVGKYASSMTLFWSEQNPSYALVEPISDNKQDNNKHPKFD